TTVAACRLASVRLTNMLVSLRKVGGTAGQLQELGDRGGGAEDTGGQRCGVQTTHGQAGVVRDLRQGFLEQGPGAGPGAASDLAGPPATSGPLDSHDDLAGDGVEIVQHRLETA